MILGIRGIMWECNECNECNRLYPPANLPVSYGKPHGLSKCLVFSISMSRNMEGTLW